MILPAGRACSADWPGAGHDSEAAPRHRDYHHWLCILRFPAPSHEPMFTHVVSTPRATLWPPASPLCQTLRRPSGTPGPAEYERRHASPALATACPDSSPRVIPEIWIADCELLRGLGESSLLHPPAADSQQPVRANPLAIDTVLLPSSVPLY